MLRHQLPALEAIQTDGIQGNFAGLLTEQDHRDGIGQLGHPLDPVRGKEVDDPVYTPLLAQVQVGLFPVRIPVGAAQNHVIAELDRVAFNILHQHWVIGIVHCREKNPQKLGLACF